MIFYPIIFISTRRYISMKFIMTLIKILKEKNTNLVCTKTYDFYLKLHAHLMDFDAQIKNSAKLLV